MHVYIFKKNMLCLYIKYIYIWYNMYKYTSKSCKYFQNMLYGCVYICIYIHIINIQYTHLCKQKLVFCMLLIVLIALIYIYIYIKLEF